MLLFKKPFWDGLVSGAITLTFRRWQKPHVRAGGRYRCHPIGVLEVDEVRTVTRKQISEADAKLAGFASRAALLAYLAELGPLDDATPIWRVALHHGGDGDRVELALESSLTDDVVAAITERLAKLDAAQRWTKPTLELIERRPRVAASQLAAELGREKLDFKADVRKLKKLGLTQSFEVGYEIAPRGRAYLDAVRSAARAPRGARRPSPSPSPSRRPSPSAAAAPAPSPSRRRRPRPSRRRGDPSP